MRKRSAPRGVSSAGAWRTSPTASWLRTSPRSSVGSSREPPLVAGSFGATLMPLMAVFAGRIRRSWMFARECTSHRAVRSQHAGPPGWRTPSSGNSHANIRPPALMKEKAGLIMVFSEKGKPVARRGRKARDLSETARLPTSTDWAWSAWQVEALKCPLWFALGRFRAPWPGAVRALTLRTLSIELRPRIRARQGMLTNPF